jgi:hypothetical protein
MNRQLSRTLTVVTVLALAASTFAASPPAAILAPDDLHFGSLKPGEVVEATVWLINTEDEPLEVLRAKGSCGCTTIPRFEPQTLAPRSAVEVGLRITAPKKAGQRKTVSVTFTLQDRPPMRLPIRVETLGTAAAPGPIIVSPPELDLGRVTAADQIEAAIHLTNNGATPTRVTGVKAGCGCITFPGFAPFELDAGASADVRLRVKAPSVVGRSKTKDVTVKVDGGPPLKVPVRIQAAHPLAEALEQYLGLSEPDAGAERRYGDLRVDGSTVSALVWASEAPRAWLVCSFDEGGQIAAIRVDPITTAPAVIQSARRN